MPSIEHIELFKKGLYTLESASDFITLKNTIIHLMDVTEKKDEVYAKDAIANVLRKKQAREIQMYHAYPQELDSIDQKYRDLAMILSQIKCKLNSPEEIRALPGSQLQGLAEKGTMALVNWIKQKPVFAASSALVTAGSMFLFYKKFFTRDKEVKKLENPSDAESSFERTIRSIQKYQAFSQMTKDPEFSGNYLDVIKGKVSNKKVKPVKKKTAENMNNEWDSEEKALLRTMDTSYNELNIRPRVDFKMPELPSSNDVKPETVLDVEAKTVEPFLKKEKKVERKPRRELHKVEEKDLFKESADAIVKKSKPLEETGRLIPIIKRTKRIKKVGV